MALFEDLPEGAPHVLSDLKEEIASARRNSKALAIAFVELRPIREAALPDHNRKAVRRLLQIVGKVLRHTDKCGLLNETEILAILPGTDEPGCRVAMERLLTSNFSRIAESVGLKARLEIAELGEAEASPLGLVERVRIGAAAPA